MVQWQRAGRKWSMAFFTITSVGPRRRRKAESLLTRSATQGIFLFGLTAAKTSVQVNALTCLAALVRQFLPLVTLHRANRPLRNSVKTAVRLQQFPSWYCANSFLRAKCTACSTLTHPSSSPLLIVEQAMRYAPPHRGSQVSSHLVSPLASRSRALLSPETVIAVYTAASRTPNGPVYVSAALFIFASVFLLPLKLGTC